LETKTHLVLGGSGFIGRHVALCLAGHGQKVIVADRVPPPSPSPVGIDGGSIEYAPIDLLSRDWESLVARCDVIHHYVWTTIPQTANEDPLADLYTNVGTTIWLLELMRRYGGKRMVFTSSGGSVYGQLISTPVTEDHPLNPISAYGVSKVTAEKYISFFCAQYGIDGRIARISNPFGAGQDPNRNQGAVATFLARALEGEATIVWGDGGTVRDYIHIADVANALVRLATMPLAPLNDKPVFHIASGEGRSLNQVISAIGALLNREIEVKYYSGRPFDVPVSVLDIKRASTVLDWRPLLSFEEGLARMLKDILAGRTSYSTLDLDIACGDRSALLSGPRLRTHC
jgi:UDP-glucose 4-epimerase